MQAADSDSGKVVAGSGSVFVAGHQGMVGSALMRHLEALGQTAVVTRSRADLDLTRQAEVESFFAANAIDRIYLAAARVGGIKANDEQPADFIRENLQIQTNVIAAAHRTGVRRLLFLGSSCIYPRLAEQPMPEEALMTGTLEATNEAYAVAKIAGIKMCESYRRQHGCDFRSAMPTNLYGPNDNFEPASSHVLPALLRKFHEAVRDGRPEVEIWGSGRPRREFLHVDDMASACVYLMELAPDTYWSVATHRRSHINVGTGKDVPISDLARLIGDIAGFDGSLVFNESMPDGTPRKLLDVSRLHRLGWEARIALDDGVRRTYDWMVANWNAIEAA